MMVEWLKTCAVEEMNLVKAFHEINTFSFPMIENIQNDDIIYLYLKAPFDSILYKVIVTSVDQESMPLYEAHYYQVGFLTGNQSYFTVELLEKYPPDLFTFEFLEKNGLKKLPDFALLSEKLAYGIEYHESEGDSEEREEEEELPFTEEFY